METPWKYNSTDKYKRGDIRSFCFYHLGFYSYYIWTKQQFFSREKYIFEAYLGQVMIVKVKIALQEKVL